MLRILATNRFASQGAYKHGVLSCSILLKSRAITQFAYMRLHGLARTRPNKAKKGDIRLLERALTIFSLATVVVPLLVAGVWWVAKVLPALDAFNRFCLTAYIIEAMVALIVAINRWRRGIDRSESEKLLLEPAVAGTISILFFKQGGGILVWLILTGLAFGLAIVGKTSSYRDRKRRMS